MNNINIQRVTGGYILTFANAKQASSGNSTVVYEHVQEIFTSQRKLMQRVKELLEVEKSKDSE